MSKRLRHGMLLDRRVTFDLTEFCSACGAERALVLRMIDEGVIEPEEDDREWRFHGETLVRAKRAMRLVRDLGVNWPGAALAVDLLEQLEQMERQVKRSRR